MIKRLVPILLFISQGLFAQNFEDTWSGYFSYVSVKSISQGNDKIYAASENAIFTYDLSTEEINTISTINGLSGQSISTIYYSELFGILVIGYENGLIELVIDGNEDILTVVDIVDKQTIPPNKKRINQFNEYNSNLYIATDYGVSVFDLEMLEFGDTYFIGFGGSQIRISQTAVHGEYIYAASKGAGIIRALVDNDNLIDFEQWSIVGNGGYKGIQTLNTELYAARNDDTILKYEEGIGFVPVGNFPLPIVDFVVKDNFLIITTNKTIHTYAEGFILVDSVTSLSDYNYLLQSGLAFGNHFYMGTTELGMLMVPFGDNLANQLLPDGPINNHPFSIDASPGQLWVNFGEVDVFFNPFPLTQIGISNLREDAWTNIPFDDLFDANDLVNVTINPDNPEEIFMTSYQKGLLKIIDQTPTVLYNETNSPMDIPNNNQALGIRLYGSDFDRQGNFWTVQSRTDMGLIRVSPSGQFQLVDISTIISGENELALSAVSASREGYIFFGAVDSGLIGYNPNNDQFNKIGEEIGNGNLPTNNIRSLAFDKNNRLWIGTLKGLRVLFNVGGFFGEGANVDAQEIIILEDGVPQELLYEQVITDIEVDGSNNKWISTATSGVFYLSSNGQETIHRFTEANSPLPSDNVQDIAIDGLTGQVYFATIDGLVAFKGTSTAPRENLENVYVYPNPVRPGFDGNVTIDGLTANANVKITDILGNLVYEKTSEGGSVLWDTTAFGKYKVASGVYMVMVTTEDALETTISKIMIVR
jgi:streptogramin lyase